MMDDTEDDLIELAEFFAMRVSIFFPLFIYFSKYLFVLFWVHFLHNKLVSYLLQ